jgi:hydroxymethylpyrimidine pyrophosphatase-like HAD family hydrolase
MYAIDASKMIGVGDGLNDLELFEAVGYRIAVANADPQLIEQADEVVSSQADDGLAEVARRFL